MPVKVYRPLSIAFVLSALLGGIAIAPAAAQEATYPTRNGPKTEATLRSELTQAGFQGPWDLASMLTAFDGAAPAPARQPTPPPDLPSKPRLTPMGTTVEEACRIQAEDMAMMLNATTSGKRAGSIRPEGFFCPSASSQTAPSTTGSTSVVESRIDGDFQGWDGETIFRLQNGQIWRQSRYAYHYHYAYSPRVTIVPMSGGWKMLVDGDPEQVWVERVA